VAVVLIPILFTLRLSTLQRVGSKAAARTCRGVDDRRGALGGGRTKKGAHRPQRALPQELVVAVDGRVDAAGVHRAGLHQQRRS
jgi:hypothetical protein